MAFVTLRNKIDEPDTPVVLPAPVSPKPERSNAYVTARRYKYMKTEVCENICFNPILFDHNG